MCVMPRDEGHPVLLQYQTTESQGIRFLANTVEEEGVVVHCGLVLAWNYEVPSSRYTSAMFNRKVIVVGLLVPNRKI